MKKTLLSLSAAAVLAFAPTVKAAPVADSCLKMIWPDDYHPPVSTGYKNPDSLRVDSCLGSPTYCQKYAKKSYYMQFASNCYPFANVISDKTPKHVSDIEDKYSDLKKALLNLESKIGTIVFRGSEFDTVFINDLKINPALYVEFDRYLNCDSIIKYVMDSIPTLRSFRYLNRSCPPNTGVENDIMNQVCLLPNPVKEKLLLMNISDNEEYSIYTSEGKLIIQGVLTSEKTIYVNDFKVGFYFLKIGSKTFKFIKE